MAQITSSAQKRSGEGYILYPSRNLWSGFLFGVGLAAFVDEVIFHQLLHWHHFYDQATTNIGLVSDGVLHSFSWFATVGSLFMFADLRRRNALWLLRWTAGVFIGAGFFQLYDGVIHHKVMRLHQVRYHVDIAPYDLAWNAAGLFILIIGFFLLKRTKKKRGEAGSGRVR